MAVTATEMGAPRTDQVLATDPRPREAQRRGPGAQAGALGVPREQIVALERGYQGGHLNRGHWA